MMTSIISGILFLSLPILAGLVINQNWQIDIALIGITFKPWRSFFIVCGLPGLISFVIMSFLPESPKFVLGRGEKLRAFETLRQIHRMNVGKNGGEFEAFEIIQEPESIENHRHQLERTQQNSCFPFFADVWLQTVQLFRPPYLLTTILLCGIQFSIYWTSNGFFMYFADILNRMAVHLKEMQEPRIPMCDVINFKTMTNHSLDHSTIRNEVKAI